MRQKYNKAICLKYEIRPVNFPEKQMRHSRKGLSGLIRVYKLIRTTSQTSLCTSILKYAYVTLRILIIVFSSIYTQTGSKGYASSNFNS